MDSAPLEQECPASGNPYPGLASGSFRRRARLTRAPLHGAFDVGVPFKMRSDVAPTDRPSGDGAFDQGFQADAVACRIEAAEKIQGIATAGIVENAPHG